MDGPFGHFFSVLSKKYPPKKPLFEIGNKLANKGVVVIDTLYPFAESAINRVWKPLSEIEKRQWELFGPLLVGLVICFFGGSLTMLIVVVEVVRLTSWNRIKESLHTLHENYLIAREANKKDNLIDNDRNGVPDVQEMTAKELFSRKMKVFFASVNPVDVSVALNALFIAFLAVLAALREKFANAITFGCALTDTFKYFFPIETVLEEALPPEQKKYASTISGMIFKFVGVTLASIGRSYITTVHCALRGATLFTKSFIKLGKEYGFMDAEMDMRSSRATALVFMMGVLGFLYQASNGFTLTFPFNVLLLPFTTTNWLLDFVFRASSALA